MKGGDSNGSRMGVKWGKKSVNIKPIDCYTISITPILRL